MIHTLTDTAVLRVKIQSNNLFVFRGTKNLVINCVVTFNDTINLNNSPLNVTWLHNGFEYDMSLIASSSNETHTRNITTNVTIGSVEYNSSGIYCCVASVTGTNTYESDCIILSVSGLFNTYTYV